MTAAPATPLASRDLGPAPEPAIVRDLLRHGLMAAPVALAVGAAVWGLPGLASVAVATALVLANFALAAALQAWAVRIGLGLVMGVAMFGFLARMGVIAGVVWALGDLAWVARTPLALTLVIGHLGLLVWETRFVSASLAFPGLKPDLSKETR